MPGELTEPFEDDAQFRAAEGLSVRLPYEQHRETLKLEQEDSFAIDQRLRQEQTKDRTLWQTLQNVLTDYDAALQGKPVDVANSIVFLATELAAWITGETININGGARMD